MRGVEGEGMGGEGGTGRRTSIMRSMSSGSSGGSAWQRSACLRFSITVSAPGQGSERCCLGLMPLRCQIALMRAMSSGSGFSEG